jgi:DNA processing protein
LETIITPQERACRAGLSACLEIGSRRFRTLFNHFGSAQAIWQASQLELGQYLTPRAAQTLFKHCQVTDPSQIFNQICAQGYQICLPEDPEYPQWLAKIHDPPFILYWFGNPDCWQSLTHALAIVGTRQASAYGLEQARCLAREWAGLGIVVVSGLATGIDMAAHQGVLEAKGRTIAVLGTGLDKISPAAKRGLARQIAQDGLVLSEFPPGFSGARWSFPLRNRIISGLSQGVLVVEAGLKSGALITTDAAIEQGREVMALPGLISSAQSAGPHALIQQGAALITSSADMLETMGWTDLLDTLVKPADFEIGLTNDENDVYLVLSKMPQPIEVLAQQIEWPISQLLTILTQLELKGLVEQLSGSRYALTRSSAREHPQFQQ